MFFCCSKIKVNGAAWSCTVIISHLEWGCIHNTCWDNTNSPIWGLFWRVFHGVGHDPARDSYNSWTSHIVFTRHPSWKYLDVLSVSKYASACQTERVVWNKAKIKEWSNSSEEKWGPTLAVLHEWCFQLLLNEVSFLWYLRHSSHPSCFMYLCICICVCAFFVWFAAYQMLSDVFHVTRLTKKYLQHFSLILLSLCHCTSSPDVFIGLAHYLNLRKKKIVNKIWEIIAQLDTVQGSLLWVVQARSWSRWLPEIPSHLKHSVSLWGHVCGN